MSGPIYSEGSLLTNYIHKSGGSTGFCQQILCPKYIKHVVSFSGLYIKTGYFLGGQ